MFKLIVPLILFTNAINCSLPTNKLDSKTLGSKQTILENRINSNEFALTFLKYHYYKGQYQPISQLAHDIILQEQNGKSYEPYPESVLPFLLAFSNVAMEFVQKNPEFSDAISAYIKSGLIQDQFDKENFEEELRDEIKCVNELMNNSGLSLSGLETEIIGLLALETNAYCSAITVMVLGGPSYYSTYYLIFMDKVSEFLMKEYADEYKDKPLPPSDFLQKLGLTEQQLQRWQTAS
jgi:hypothetical protein